MCAAKSTSARNQLGLIHSGASTAAMETYETALERFRQFTGDPVSLLNDAIADSPAFTMAHVARAYMFIVGTDPEPRDMVLAALPTLRTLPATSAEATHVEVVARLARGEWRSAARLLEDIAIAEPRDILALQIGQLFDLMLGETRMLRDRIARALPFWSAGMPGYSAMLGMHAFGLEETGDYARAEADGRRAIELDPRDSWAQHAVAHVCEMQGRAADGVDWMLEGHQRWSTDNFFAVHNWWHTALFYLELDESREALRLYDGPVYGAKSQLAYDMIDASALLWRLSLRGVDVGSRWDELAQNWAGIASDCRVAFNDAHAAMALAMAGRAEDLDRLRTTQARAEADGSDYASVLAETGRDVFEGIVAFAERDYPRSVDLLRVARPAAHRYGGSHAQRDLIDLTLIEAALRGGQTSLAKALTHERAGAKPGHASAAALVRRATTVMARSAA